MFNLLKLNVFIFLIIQMYIILIYILFIKIYVYRKLIFVFYLKCLIRTSLLLLAVRLSGDDSGS